jgi:hypothetical protein
VKSDKQGGEMLDRAAQMSYHPRGHKGDYRYQRNNPMNVTSAPGAYSARNLYGDGEVEVAITGAAFAPNPQQWYRHGEPQRLPRELEAQIGDGPAPGGLAMSARFQGREGMDPEEGIRRGVTGGMNMSFGGRQQQSGRIKSKPQA